MSAQPIPIRDHAETDDERDWARGAEALSRMPAAQRLSHLRDLEDEKRRAMAEVAAMDGHLQHIKFGLRPELAGLPVPIFASAAELPAAAGAYHVYECIRPGITMIAGEEGSGKSYLTRQLAMLGAIGAEHFLVPCYAIARPLRVLIADEDNGEAEEFVRAEHMRGQLGVERRDLWRLSRISLAGVQLDQERWQTWLLALIDELDLDLLILDPISEMHGGEELRRDPQFKRLLAFLKRLKVERPMLAVLLVHDVRKSPAGERTGTRALRDVRGQWGQTPDVVAVLSPLGEGRVRWELHKRVPRSSLILEQRGGIFACVAEEGQRKPTADDRVLAAVEAGARQIDEVLHATGLAARTAWNAVRRLRKSGLLAPRGELELTGGER